MYGKTSENAPLMNPLLKTLQESIIKCSIILFTIIK